MVRTYEGGLDGRRLRVAVVAGRFNDAIGKRLVEGALDCLRRHGSAEEDLSVVWVPGAFELPVVAKRLAESAEFDAIVCVGVVIRGDTPHFDFVAGEAASGIARASLETSVPVMFGVITADTVEQADQRSGGKMGNKGFEAAQAALEMANLLSSLPKPSE